MRKRAVASCVAFRSRIRLHVDGTTCMDGGSLDPMPGRRDEAGLVSTMPFQHRHLDHGFVAVGDSKIVQEMRPSDCCFWAASRPLAPALMMAIGIVSCRGAKAGGAADLGGCRALEYEPED